MLARLQQLFSKQSWQHVERPWYGSLGFSALLHVVIVALLAGIWLSPSAGENITPVETVLAPATEIGPIPFVSDGDPLSSRSSEVPEETEQGGGKVSLVKLANDDQVSFNPKAPALPTTSIPIA